MIIMKRRLHINSFLSILIFAVIIEKQGLCSEESEESETMFIEVDIRPAGFSSNGSFDPDHEIFESEAVFTDNKNGTDRTFMHEVLMSTQRNGENWELYAIKYRLNRYRPNEKVKMDKRIIICSIKGNDELPRHLRGALSSCVISEMIYE